MGSGLLEREVELQVLDAALARAVAGTGSVVLLFGEAGIGKTTVLRAFLGAAAGRVRVLVGGCEDLLTPRTLGPIRDIARGTVGPLAGALAGDERESVFGALCPSCPAARRCWWWRMRTGRTRRRSMCCAT